MTCALTLFATVPTGGGDSGVMDEGRRGPSECWQSRPCPIKSYPKRTPVLSTRYAREALSTLCAIKRSPSVVPAQSSRRTFIVHLGAILRSLRTPMDFTPLRCQAPFLPEMDYPPSGGGTL